MQTDRIRYGSLVKRLRRRPLTAESGVRFPYELLTRIVQPKKIAYSSLRKRLFFYAKVVSSGK